MVEPLMDKIPLFRQWIGVGGVFDHHSIFLELQGDQRKSGSTFKYNSSWIKDESFRKLVADNWSPFNTN